MPKAKYTRLIAFAASSLILPCAVQPAHSQVLYGSLVGNVTDPSSAGVFGAIVRITQLETNQSRQTQTSDTGIYSFPAIPAGAYAVEVRKSGFQTATRQEVAVRNNSVVRVDFTLLVGTLTENIQVTAEAAALQTDGADVRAEIAPKALENLPVPPGRNFQNLLVMVPGVTPPQNANSVSANPARSLAFMAGGVERSGNVMTIDGASVESTWLQQIAAYVPSLESVEIVNVETNSFDAAQGFAGGAAVNVQVKGGSNQIHGSAFEYNFNNAMTAKPFFLPSGQPNPKSILNQFGGTVGGPIKRQKLFYFLSYDGALTRQNASAYGTVPTAAIRSGNMSGSTTAIYDPQTGQLNGTGRTPFPGNLIPPSQIDPIAQKIVNLTPLPTFPNLLANNYYASAPYSYTRDTTDAKVNYNVSAKLNLSARFGWIKYSMDDPPMFGALGGSPVSSAGGAAGLGHGNVFSNTVSGNYLLSAHFIVDAYFGYTLLDSNVEPPGLDRNVGLDILGIPGTNGPSRSAGGWPGFSVSSYSALGNQSTVPFYFHNGNYQYVASANWTNGAHTFRFGVDTLCKELNMFQELNQASGTFSFGPGTTGLSGGPSQNQYNSYASFLLGRPSSLAKGEENGNNTNSEWFYALYVQDKWQAARKLTVSYGLRWEYYGQPAGDMQRYNPVNNMMSICGAGSVPSDCGTHFSKRLFAPRAGIAYRPSEGFVIRAGYGISWDPFFVGQQILRVYPNQISYSVSGVNSYQPATLLSAGIPPLAFPQIGNGILGMPGTVSLNSMGDNYIRSYIQSWNVMLQKQLKWGFVAQAGYVATRQVHQQYEIDINNGNVLGAGQAGEALNQLFGRTASTKFFEPFAHSHYDALQATLSRRFAGGYQIQANYSWSKAISLCCADSEDASPQISIPAYIALNRAVEPFDRTQVFTFSGIAELPLGRGKRWLNRGGLATAVASGWQVNGLFSAYTGTPFTVTGSSTSLNAPGNTQTADQIKPHVAIPGGVGPGQSFFDPLAYASVTQVRFGTSGFDSLRGPGLVNLDFSLFRTFRVSERVRVQFRAQAFNFTNTPHFANPGSNVANLVLNANGTVNNLGGFSVITATTGNGREGVDQRVFQLALRLSF
jgi:hypothetical protein